MAGNRDSPDRYPPLHMVLSARELDGLPGGAAAPLGQETTAALDTVLGSVDFMEIANAHLYSSISIIACSTAVIPCRLRRNRSAELSGARIWPFLGGMRMYAQVGGRRDLLRGRTP